MSAIPVFSFKLAMSRRQLDVANDELPIDEAFAEPHLVKRQVPAASSTDDFEKSLIVNEYFSARLA